MNFNLLNDKIDDWYGFKRHVFEFEGREAWIVEPDQPLEDNRWTWCLEWPTAFVLRTGVPALLKKGYYHVHVHATGHGNEPDQQIFRKSHDFLLTLGFAPKARLIGLSFGGLYSLRYAAKNPGMVQAIYLDAPVCSFVKFKFMNIVKDEYGIYSDAEADVSPEMPVNMVDKLTDIPILLVYGTDDLSVDPALNCEMFAERFQKAGGKIDIVKRPLWGHHPHGLDDVSKILDFM